MANGTMKMLEMTIYWRSETDVDDLIDDLELIGEQIRRPTAFENGSRIVTVRNRLIKNGLYRTAELYLDSRTSREIQYLFRKGNFKQVTAVSITETTG